MSAMVVRPPSKPRPHVQPFGDRHARNRPLSPRGRRPRRLSSPWPLPSREETAPARPRPEARRSGLEGGPLPRRQRPMGVVAPEVGRKIHSKPLKSLVWRKKKEAREPLSGGFCKRFRREKAHLCGQKAPLSAQQRRTLDTRKSKCRRLSELALTAATLVSSRGNVRFRRRPVGLGQV
jgi:hypothetical protein